MGTETEYGITVPGQTTANHMLASSQVVNGYLNATTGAPRDRRPRWDFEEESPLRDARGFDAAAGPVIGASRDAADSLADDEIGLANVILTNGARLYVDHAHPEYSTPEVTNPRDEPHADPERYRRLHVIIGDANMSEVSTYLKLGTTALVLAMIEERWLTETGVDFTVDAPVASLRAVSHDPSLKYQLTLRDGRRLTGVQLQMEYFEQARKFVEDRYGSDTDEQTIDVLTRWESVLTRLTDDPMSLSRELDWA